MIHSAVRTWPLLALLVVLMLGFLFKGAFISPPAIDPDHPFNTERAFERLTRILGDEAPHPVDSAANDLVIERLMTEISDMGFTPFRRDDFHCLKTWGSQRRCARLQNVGFWVTEPGPNAVLLLSHHDSVPAGPGASDDGAGIAASLEIASLMKDRTLERPLLVLITDGEEFGLMGANLFVEEDPLAEMVGAVVNMEARGVRGPAALAQTSRPNSRDLKTLQSSTRLPVASSLNADVYELMPNDTDMTEFLELDIDAANLAYAGGERFYHTPGDNLTNMDKRSLFNMGASGLAAAEVFLRQTGEEAEGQLLYTDLLGIWALKMPLWLVGCGLGFCLIAALTLLFQKQDEGGFVTKIFAPPAAIIVGVGLAIGASMLVDYIRPEASFGAAYPIALRGLHATMALLGALLVYGFLIRNATRETLWGTAGLWLSLMGLIGFKTVQGSAILFAPTAIVLGVGLFLLLSRRGRTGAAICFFSALLFAVIALPLAALGESGLLIENAAPFSLAILLLFILFVPLVWSSGRLVGQARNAALAFGAITSVGFLVASITVPAYSVDAPAHVSISHIQGEDFQTPVWSVAGTNLPEPMQSAAAFEIGELPVFGGPRNIASAPPFETAGINIAAMTDVIIDEQRQLTLDIEAPDVDRLLVFFRGDTEVLSAEFKGETLSTEEGALRQILCIGRACQTGQLIFDFAADAPAPNITLIGYTYGLGPESAQLVASRPDWALQRQNGDQRIQVRTVWIDPDQSSEE